MSVKNFHGIYAATIVPMKQDGTIDKDILTNHLKDLSSVKGIKGLFSLNYYYWVYKCD